MRRISIELSTAQRREVQRFRSRGLHLAREVTRAHVLAALDKGLDDGQIAAVLGVSRAMIWRTRSAYQEKGLEYALHDAARAGAPRTYATDQEAAVTALACSPAPKGRKRWTVGLLTAAARQQDRKLKTVSRETVRRWLKKTS
jgi:transposase